jgi:hypothetical protein
VTFSPGAGSAATTQLIIHDTTIINNATGVLIHPSGGIAANASLRWLRIESAAPCRRGQLSLRHHIAAAALEQRSRLTKAAIGASGFNPNRCSAATSIVLRCRQDRQRTAMTVRAAGIR